MPIQGRWPVGIISQYEFSISNNNKIWETVATGEFSNIKNNPIEQIVKFNTSTARYIKLKGLTIIDNDKRLSIGEIGVITN